MSLERIESIYAILPSLFQNVMCSCYGAMQNRTKYGKAFHRYLEGLNESDKWSESEIEAYQNEKVRNLVKDAFASVPYYRDIMKQMKLTPRDVQTREDLVKLPILTKEDVRHNVDRLVSEKARRRGLILRHTSGTTGKMLCFYNTNAANAFQWAVWWRHRMRFGLKWGMWHANFTVKLVVPLNQTKPPYWRWNLPARQAMITIHHLTPSKIRDLFTFLDQSAFEFYTGYPSAIHILFLTAKEQGVSLVNHPRVIATFSENVLSYQRRDIQDGTNAILTDHYGFSEACGNASQCAEFLYHEDFEFGIIERVETGKTQDRRRTGRIICTGFACPEFPFIRYDVGDIGVWEDPSKKCKCGRSSRTLIAIEGRIHDYIITPEGRRIMRLDYAFKDAANVKEAQIVQETMTNLTIRIVKRPAYDTGDEAQIEKAIKRWTSPRMQVRFEYVPEVERGSTGKYEFIRSFLGSRQSGDAPRGQEP